MSAGSHGRPSKYTIPQIPHIALNTLVEIDKVRIEGLNRLTSLDSRNPNIEYRKTKQYQSTKTAKGCFSPHND
jgi:hypothetical protein